MNWSSRRILIRMPNPLDNFLIFSMKSSRSFDHIILKSALKILSIRKHKLPFTRFQILHEITYAITYIYLRRTPNTHQFHQNSANQIPPPKFLETHCRASLFLGTNHFSTSPHKQSSLTDNKVIRNHPFYYASIIHHTSLHPGNKIYLVRAENLPACSPHTDFLAWMSQQHTPKFLQLLPDQIPLFHLWNYLIFCRLILKYFIFALLFLFKRNSSPIFLVYRRFWTLLHFWTLHFSSVVWKISYFSPAQVFPWINTLVWISFIFSPQIIHDWATFQYFSLKYYQYFSLKYLY